jgi:hypothetical protein
MRSVTGEAKEPVPEPVFDLLPKVEAHRARTAPDDASRACRRRGFDMKG